MVDRVVELEHLLNRCRALISNAGDGDWNRESGEWQLAAAELLRDLDGRPAPEPFTLEPHMAPEDAVMRALGAASTCWTEIRNAGVFDAGRAQQIGRELLRYLRDREQPAQQEWPEQDPEATQSISAADITSGVLMTPEGDGSRYAVSEPRYYGPGGEIKSEPEQGARVEVSVEHGVRAFDVDGRQVAPLTPEQEARNVEVERGLGS